jgi:hypothetical protein
MEKFAVEARWANIHIGSRSKILPWRLWRCEKRDTIVIQKRKAEEKLTTGIQTKVNVL